MKAYQNKALIAGCIFSTALYAGNQTYLPGPDTLQNIPRPEKALPQPNGHHISTSSLKPQKQSAFYLEAGAASNFLKTNNGLLVFSDSNPSSRVAATLKQSKNHFTPIIGAGWWHQSPTKHKKPNWTWGAQILYQPSGTTTLSEIAIAISRRANKLGAPNTHENMLIKTNGEIGLLGNIAIPFSQNIYAIAGGGLAIFPNVDYSVVFNTFHQSAQKTLTGGLGQVGLAYQLSPQLGANLSYLYTKTGSKRFKNLSDISLSNHQLMMMLSWTFHSKHKPKKRADISHISKTVLRN